MSCPLLKSCKPKGSTFYSFSSTSHNPNPNFSKFVLINIPAKEEDKILDFNKDTLEQNFGIYTELSLDANTYADQMIESLRNYIENQDVTFLESKLSTTKDFYNILEPTTPTEKIFWKWFRKFGAMDFEPAEHKVDWDKNLPDFENPYVDITSDTDYFRKYLWKEREVIDYTISSIVYEGTNIAKLIIEYFAKFKVNDRIILSGDTGTQILTGVSYNVDRIEYSGTTRTEIYITQIGFNSTVSNPTASVRLNYKRVVQYIGEINYKSDVHTASKDETEVIAYIPHQAGKTPTILFQINTDTNYTPGLELPILSEQIQTEIRGAENYTSPIRKNPSDYPGSYYGMFDTENKTYQMESGDKIRLKGDYFGIQLNNSVGTQSDTYVEKLSDFNSNLIDGLGLDFNLKHYLKMNITKLQVGFNFDEFNQLSINNLPPEDFEYNAVLWYYDVNDGVNTYSNLYGITFLNNPNNDDDISDINGTHISTFKKLVSTEEQDGLSYQHVLSLSTSIDNDTSSLSFDPLTLYNTNNFDLYTNIMSNLGKLNESFINIINEFVRINIDLNDVKSIIYTQTDMDLIKSKLKNLEELLKLYSQYQFVDTETVKIESKFDGVYPTLGFNVKGVEYENIIQLTSDEIYNYKYTTSTNIIVNIPETSKLFLKITNTNNNQVAYDLPLGIVLNNDLIYKQSVEIYLEAKDCLFPDSLSININFNDGVNGITTVPLIENVYLPIDIGDVVPNIKYHKNKYLNQSVFQYVNVIERLESSDKFYLLLYTTSANIFGNSSFSEWVYISDLKFLDSDGNLIDKSGMYSIAVGNFNPAYIKIEVSEDLSTLTPVGIPQIYSYKYLKIKILRVGESSTSTIEDRYLIEKMFI